MEKMTVTFTNELTGIHSHIQTVNYQKLSGEKSLKGIALAVKSHNLLSDLLSVPNCVRLTYRFNTSL